MKKERINRMIKAEKGKMILNGSNVHLMTEFRAISTAIKIYPILSDNSIFITFINKHSFYWKMEIIV